MRSIDFSSSGANKNQGGFTLLELIISMVVFLVVSAAVFSLMQLGQKTRSAVSENVGLAKNVRLALNLLGRDTYNAGLGYPLTNTVVLPDNRIATLLGIPADVDTSRDTVAPITPGNNITLNNYNTTANTRTDQVTFFFKDTSFNLVGGVSQPLNINAATTTTGGIDEIVPISGSNSACRVNDIFLVTGNTGATLAVATALSGSNKVQFSNGDSLGFNLTGTSGPLRSITTPASLQRMIMVTYYVTADGTLMRREYANVTPVAAFVDEPLVYGVENFQVQYVMDDGTSSANPSAGPNGIAGDADDTPANLLAVRQIRYTVSVRSTERNAAGQFYRTSQTSTFSTRNLGYDVN